MGKNKKMRAKSFLAILLSLCLTVTFGGCTTNDIIVAAATICAVFFGDACGGGGSGTKTELTQNTPSNPPPTSDCTLTNASIDTLDNTGCCPSSPTTMPPVVNPPMVCVNTRAVFRAIVEPGCVPNENVSWSVTKGASSVSIVQSQGRYLKVNGGDSATDEVTFRASATSGSTLSTAVTVPVNDYKSPTIEVTAIVARRGDGTPAIGTGADAASIKSSAKTLIEEDFKNVNNIWGQCCIKFKLKDVQVLANNDSYYDIPAEDGEPDDSTLEQLVNVYRGTGTIEIYYVNSMGRYPGNTVQQAFWLGKNYGIVIGTEVIERDDVPRWFVEGHELGHIVGRLPDLGDPDLLNDPTLKSLMHFQAITPDTPLDLDENECGYARSYLYYNTYTD